MSSSGVKGCDDEHPDQVHGLVLGKKVLVIALIDMVVPLSPYRSVGR